LGREVSGHVGNIVLSAVAADELFVNEAKR